MSRVASKDLVRVTDTGVHQDPLSESTVMGNGAGGLSASEVQRRAMHAYNGQHSLTQTMGPCSGEAGNERVPGNLRGQLGVRTDEDKTATELAGWSAGGIISARTLEMGNHRSSLCSSALGSPIRVHR